MNEQLQTALSELINKAVSGIDASVSFMSAQLPDIITQLLTWYAVKGLIFFALGILLIIAWVVCEIKAFKKFKEIDDEDGWIFGYGLIGLFARLIVFITLVCIMSLDWLQIFIAPKIWLIEYAASMVK